MVALVGDYILIIGVRWSSWIMENEGQREREREREIEGIGKSETRDFSFPFCCCASCQFCCTSFNSNVLDFIIIIDMLRCLYCMYS